MVKPSLLEVAQRNQKIDALVLEMEVHRRLRQSVSGSLQDPDSLLAQMQAVFEENARLNIELSEFKQQVLLLSAENKFLTKEIERFRGKNQPEDEYEMEL